MENLNAEQVMSELDCQTRFAKFSNSNGVLISVKCAQFVLDHVQYYEQRIKELSEENERLRAEKELNENEEKYILSTVMVAPIEYTVEEYRKRVYRKMEKYTVFGREYIQRIMREVAKEMLEGNNEN